MSIIKSNAIAPPSGGLSSISEMNSLRFDGSSYLSRSLSTGSTTKFTYSFWFKRVSGAPSSTDDILWFASNGTGYTTISFLNDSLRFNDITNNSINDFNAIVTSDRVFRDFSAFYHIVISVDAAQTSLNDKFKLYVNGISSSLHSSSYFTDSVLSVMNTATTAYIGQQSNIIYLSGYMANIHFIDGQALGPEHFGQKISDVWVPKQYDPAISGGYGTNGFRLLFDSKNAIESDVVGGNNGTNYGVTLVYDADYGDNVAKFDGSQYIAIPSTATAYYISAWVYYDGTDTTGLINRTVHHNSWWKGFDLHLNQGKAKITLFNQNPPGNSALDSTGSLVTGWNHVYFEVTTSAHKLVLNNGAVDTNGHTISWAGSSTLHFGRRLLHSTYTSYSTGKLANVKLFSSPLSASEITSLYNKEEVTNGLIAHYPLNDDLGGTFKDSSGNGNHWTAN